MNPKSKVGGLASLIQAGQNAEQNLKGATIQSGETPQANNTDDTKKENEIFPSRKPFERFFVKTEEKEVEAIRISRSLQAKLKILAAISGTSISSIASNMIQEIISENEKEINKYIKSNL